MPTVRLTSDIINCVISKSEVLKGLRSSNLEEVLPHLWTAASLLKDARPLLRDQAWQGRASWDQHIPELNSNFVDKLRKTSSQPPLCWQMDFELDHGKLTLGVLGVTWTQRVALETLFLGAAVANSSGRFSVIRYFTLLDTLSVREGFHMSYNPSDDCATPALWDEQGRRGKALFELSMRRNPSLVFDEVIYNGKRSPAVFQEDPWTGKVKSNVGLTAGKLLEAVSEVVEIG